MPVAFSPASPEGRRHRRVLYRLYTDHAAEKRTGSRHLTGTGI